MLTHAASAPVATAARAINPKSTVRGSVSTASLSTNAAASRSAQFVQGERAAAFSLRQRRQSSAVSKRSLAKRVVSASASSGVPAVQAAAASEWKGAKLKPLGYSVLAGLLIWLIPAPAGVSAQAWHLLAVFVGTIVGIITNVRPRPVDPIPSVSVRMLPPLRGRYFSLSTCLTADALPRSFDRAASSPRCYRDDRSWCLHGDRPVAFRRRFQCVLV